MTKRNRELMDLLFVLMRDTISSGLEKPSIKERNLQKNHNRELKELGYEKLKGMIKEFRVIQ